MTIYSATANNQTINLTEADDTVILGAYNNITVQSYRNGTIPSDEVVSLGSGTGDTIYASIGDTVIGGSGGATLDSEGHGNTYLLGDGSFAASGLASGDTFIAGNGNDLIYTENFSSDIYISLGNGNNRYLPATGTSLSTIEAGNGNNYVGDSAGSHDSFLLGNGQNTLSIGADDVVTAGLGSSRESDTVSVFYAYAAVTLGDGNNTIDADEAGSVTITVGNGNNTIDPGNGSTVFAGNGNNAIEFIGTGSESHFRDMLYLGDGNNDVTLPSESRLVAGDGNNTVQAYSDDTLRLGDGNNSITIGGVSVDLSLGDGNNTVHLLEYSADVSMTLGNGDNTITAPTVTGSFLLSVGTGDDIVDLRNYDALDGDFAFTQATGGGVQTIDLTGADIATANMTITNRDDVIDLYGASISAFNLTVNADGFKLPDGMSFTDTSGSPSPTAQVTYGLTHEAINTAFAQAQPLPYFIADLLPSPAPRWNTALGQQATLDFSFMQSVPSYANSDDATGFAAIGGNLPAGLSPSQLLADNTHHLDGVTLTAEQVAAVTSLADWEAISGVSFVSSPDGNDVPIRIGSNNEGFQSAGYAYLPFSGDFNNVSSTGLETGGGSEAGDLYINNGTFDDITLVPSQYWKLVFIHEIGHALGMGGESGNADPFDILPGGTLDVGGGEDSGVYTVMSYNDPPGTSTIPIDTPGAFDIASIQYLYGANPNYDANPSHIWSFSSTYGNTRNLIDGVGSATDEIAAGSWSGVGSIDLRQGHWSRLGAQQTDTLSGALGQPDILAADQLFIDYGTEVNFIDAHLTSGAMTLVANDGDDSIACGSGTDLVVVAAGHDTVTGGAGIDTVLFQAASTDYTIQVIGFDDYVVTADSSAYGGTDYLSGVADLAFTDTTVALSVTTTVVESFMATEIAALSLADIGRRTSRSYQRRRSTPSPRRRSAVLLRPPCRAWALRFSPRCRRSRSKA